MHNILAGVANMGINFQCSILHRCQWSHKNLWDFSTSIACWALLHLGTSSEWKRKVIDECKALIDQYTNMTSSDPLHMAWEDKLLSLDLIIHETLHHIQIDHGIPPQYRERHSSRGSNYQTRGLCYIYGWCESQSWHLYEPDDVWPKQIWFRSWRGPKGNT